ncbi:MAG TPA: sensor domain-containing protein [Nocardioidaceae bacterium]|nr:sensor domain-containing protein [Nocardioidaceae bacterium]
MSDLSRRPGRFALVGWSTGFVFSGAVGALLMALSIVAIVLVPVVVGVLMLVVLVPMTRGLARWQRGWASRVLRHQISSPYLVAGDRRGKDLVRFYGSDIASWRDLAWLAVSLVVGVLTSAIYLGLLAVAVFFAIYPWLWAITPPGTFNADFGFFTVRSQSTAFLAMPLGAAVFGLWSLIGRRVMSYRARIDQALLSPTESAALKVRVQHLAESRADAVDTQAAELRRIERDLHDGAQARIVALGMSLGMAEEVLASDPEAARDLLVEARTSASAAMAELRSLVRGIHPPVLADRGLDGAVRALALASTMLVKVEVNLSGRLPAPVESAAYFCVAETLTNVVKHSRAPSAEVKVYHDGASLFLETRDVGVGGADQTKGTGLRGIARRLSAFDGSVSVTSPIGGPTVVHMEVPCVLS